MLNKVQIIGRLGADPESRRVGDKAATVTNFSVACSEKWTDKNTGEVKERTEWIRVTAWAKLGELCAKHLKKGRQVYVEGRLQTRSWGKEDGTMGYATEVQADQVLFLGDKPQEEQQSQAQQQAPAPRAAMPTSNIPNLAPQTTAKKSSAPF